MLFVDIFKVTKIVIATVMVVQRITTDIFGTKICLERADGIARAIRSNLKELALFLSGQTAAAAAAAAAGSYCSTMNESDSDKK